MCGIAGLVNFDESIMQDKYILEKMIKTLTRRGPDSEGTYISQNVMLGHLSKESNFPELAYKTVIDELCANNFDENKIKVGIANRSNPSEILNLEVS